MALRWCYILKTRPLNPLSLKRWLVWWCGNNHIRASVTCLCGCSFSDTLDGIFNDFRVVVTVVFWGTRTCMSAETGSPSKILLFVPHPHVCSNSFGLFLLHNARRYFNEVSAVFVLTTKISGVRKFQAPYPVHVTRLVYSKISEVTSNHFVWRTNPNLGLN